MADFTSLLPGGMKVFERGWLSANNILFVGHETSALVDTGYCTHAEQSVRLVRGCLGDRPLDIVINTHLHSDHCGGNAAFQSAYAGVETWIPPGLAAEVQRWDPEALGYFPTGQLCPRFHAERILKPGSEMQLGDHAWQVHAAPGHDPHSIILFEPVSRTLISADALWERGFGVVFPEIDGDEAFKEVAATLNLIEQLRPSVIVPGHGAPFVAIIDALTMARARLQGFVDNPRRHALHAAKVLLKFKLLELQHVETARLADWAANTRYLGILHRRWFAEESFVVWVNRLLDDLCRMGAAARVPGKWVNL